ncbi:hypothetical protein PoB_005492800 [Plakobranchus ocellatus]|uniref:Uncharacterized protein n=1 Tax=Plakobranchus ocellatus TaxID=259542 RepID=A0AAV4CBS0_9GAST|nr:hypothetical protein PoB_005492800 [Plakobranchus ocellatus]
MVAANTKVIDIVTAKKDRNVTVTDLWFCYPLGWSVGGTVAIKSALRSAGTFLSRVRAPLPTLWAWRRAQKPEITLL